MVLPLGNRYEQALTLLEKKQGRVWSGGTCCRQSSYR